MYNLNVAAEIKAEGIEPYNTNLNKQTMYTREVVVSIENKVKGAEEETSKEASSTAVSVSSEAQSKFNLDEIPEIILKNKKIRNVKRYWGSLRPAVKIEYWQEQEKKDRLKKEREEQERQKAERKARRLCL